jgi:hypothetical protein
VRGGRPDDQALVTLLPSGGRDSENLSPTEKVEARLSGYDLFNLWLVSIPVLQEVQWHDGHGPVGIYLQRLDETVAQSIEPRPFVLLPSIRIARKCPAIQEVSEISKLPNMDCVIMDGSQMPSDSKGITGPVTCIECRKQIFNPLDARFEN